MIVRILGDGPYELGDDQHADIHRLDEAMGAALEGGDGAALEQALGQLIAQIRSVGTPVPPDDLRPSDLVVPHEGSTLDEVQALLASEG